MVLEFPYCATFCFARPVLQSTTVGTLLAVTLAIHIIKGILGRLYTS